MWEVAITDEMLELQKGGFNKYNTIILNYKSNGTFFSCFQMLHGTKRIYDRLMVKAPIGRRPHR